MVVIYVLVVIQLDSTGSGIFSKTKSFDSKISDLYKIGKICYQYFNSVLTFLVSSSGIDCFKCVSINGSNRSCNDPFHNNYTVDILKRPCMGGRKGRNGLFPASSCTKVVGSYGIYARLFFN